MFEISIIFSKAFPVCAGRSSPPSVSFILENNSHSFIASKCYKCHFSQPAEDHIYSNDQFNDDQTLKQMVSKIQSPSQENCNQCHSISQNINENIIIPSDFDKSFYIYPNPFGRGETEEQRGAFFNVYLEQTSDVSIRVFTLLGDLVWKSQTKTLTEGVHPRQFRWDGKNGKGKRVLNGAYLGVLEVRPTGGGSVRRTIIKIAYIK